MLSGSLELRWADQVAVLGAGEAFVVPAGVPHGARALDAGCELLECYAPPATPPVPRLRGPPHDDHGCPFGPRHLRPVRRRRLGAAHGRTDDVAYQPLRRARGRQLRQGERPEVDLAVAAARRAFDETRWPTAAAPVRATVLRRAAELLRERADMMGRRISLELGKPISLARNEVLLTADVFDYYAALTVDVRGEAISQHTPKALGLVLNEPVGVVAMITPWNFPLLLLSWKVAPAIAAGCTMIAKPASLTPGSALDLAGVLADAGLPARRVQRHHGQRRRGRHGARLPSRRRQDRLHRLHRGRTAGHDRRGHEHQEGHPRARREVAEHRVRRCRPRAGRARGVLGNLLQHRTGVPGGEPAAGAARGARRVRRRAARDDDDEPSGRPARGEPP